MSQGWGGGGGGNSHFSSDVWSGLASTVHPKNQEFQVPQKIFEILATPKNIPHYVP